MKKKTEAPELIGVDPASDPTFTYYSVRRNPTDGLWCVYRSNAGPGEQITPSDSKQTTIEKLMRLYDV